MASPVGGRTGRSYGPLNRVLPHCLRLPQPHPLPLWFLLDESMDLEAPPAGLEHDWASLECHRRMAYGCGQHGQKVLDGLTLYVRLLQPICKPMGGVTRRFEHVTSALYIHASDDALRGIRALFGERGEPPIPIVGDGSPIPIDGDPLSARGIVMTGNGKLIVLSVVFHLRHYYPLAYYIAYDAVNKFLSMVPCPPEPTHVPTGFTTKPLTVPRDPVGHDLIVMTRKIVPPPPEGRRYVHAMKDVLYVWTPLPRMKMLEDDHPWLVLERHFLVPLPGGKGFQDAFVAEVMFEFKGKAYFVDLAQGIVSCDLSSAADSSVIGFDFIPLPSGIPSAFRWEKVNIEDTGPLNVDRTMGCIYGTIKFVCIDRSMKLHRDMVVTVWSLDWTTKQWTKDKEFSAKELWSFLNFSKLGLPKTAPKCPVLMPDGTLTVLLPNLCKTEQDPIEDYICNFIVSSMKFMWSARLDTCSDTEPIVLPQNVFGTLDYQGKKKVNIFK